MELNELYLFVGSPEISGNGNHPVSSFFIVLAIVLLEMFELIKGKLFDFFFKTD